MLLLAVGSRQSRHKTPPGCFFFVVVVDAKMVIVSHVVSFLDSWTVEMESSFGL